MESNRKKNFISLIVPVVSIAALLLFATAAWASDQEATLYYFTGGSDGWQPSSGLVTDGAGNFYGTTMYGGSCAVSGHGCGTVFKLSPGPDGVWAQTVVHEFTAQADGEWPSGNLVLDREGNLFGTTAVGGRYHHGIVFELTPTSSGFTEEIIYSFGTINDDGESPNGGLAIDASGTLYGTTILGGAHSNGTVFRLSSAAGNWSEKILYAFTGGTDGGWPYGGVAIDSTGKLYGTTSLHGATGTTCSDGCGTVFRLTPTAGQPLLSTLYSFTGSTGAGPLGKLILDSAGNIYGTTQHGGTSCSISGGCGVVFELTPGTRGWHEVILHDFANTNDAGDPQAGLLLDAEGNLYGTAPGSEAYAPSVVFELSPSSNNDWQFHNLYTFAAGNVVALPLYLEPNGDVFGTSAAGGNLAYGSAYRLSPAGNDN